MLKLLGRQYRIPVMLRAMIVRVENIGEFYNQRNDNSKCIHKLEI